MMMTMTNPLVSQSNSSSDAAALQGASLAFQQNSTNQKNKKPPPPPVPPPVSAKKKKKKDNGALTAAVSSVGRPRSPVEMQSTGGSDVGGASPGQLHPAMAGAGRAIDPKSPSFIAATLAASRSASPSPKANVGTASETSGGEVAAAVDSGSIAPTGSLISMFERGRPGDPVKRSPAGSIGDGDGDGDRDGDAEDERSRSPVKTKPPRVKPKPRPIMPSSPSPEVVVARTAAPEVVSPKPKRLSKPEILSEPDLRPATPPRCTAGAKSEVASPGSRRKPDSQLKPDVQHKPSSRSKEVVVESTPEVTSPRAKGGSKPELQSKPELRPRTSPRETVKGTPEATSSKRPSRRLSKPELQPKTPPHIITRAATEILSPPCPDPEKRSPKPVGQRAPTPPKPRGSTKGAPKPAVGEQRLVAAPRRSKSRPPPPPVTRRKSFTPTTPDQRPGTADTVSSDDTFVSASSVQSPERSSLPPPLPGRKHAPASLPPSPTREIHLSAARPRRPTNASTSSLALDNLANAIVASSLASARLTPHNTGGSLSRPPLPKRQKSPRLMQTLRQPARASDDESDRHKKSPLHKLHSGKHAHHEGSRKKWREEITPRERKRYEAVWASNRGLLLAAAPNANASSHNGGGEVSEYVVNVVVREIWKRSRLPADELAEVWDLVNREKRGMLSRQEFVVGMWLVDQRLRGRKIPAKVSDSVWGSANGVKVIKPRVK